MKLISVIYKLLSSDSPINSAFVLKLSGLLESLKKVAENGGVLVVRLSIDGNQVVITESTEQLPKAKPAPRKSATTK